MQKHLVIKWLKNLKSNMLKGYFLYLLQDLKPAKQSNRWWWAQISEFKVVKLIIREVGQEECQQIKEKA